MSAAMLSGCAKFQGFGIVNLKAQENFRRAEFRPWNFKILNFKVYNFKVRILISEF